MAELNVRIVQLTGSYYEFGLQQAEEIKTTKFIEQIQPLKMMSSSCNVTKAKELPVNYSPYFLEELTGIADGLEMTIEDVIKLYSGYDLLFPSMGCTAYVNENFYVRNYDFSPDWYDARIVFSKPANGYATVGFSQQITGRLDGMNEKGLVVGLHFVNTQHRGEGFLATTIVRMLLEQCSCIDEAIEFITTIPHGYCYNYSLTDGSGKSVIVEASPEKQFVHFANPLICTNHFETPELTKKNRENILGSIKRKEYVSSLLTKDLTPKALYHHFNDGNSPLFFKYYQQFFGTLHTVVYSPKDLTLIVGIGENCEPKSFSLKKFLDGDDHLPKIIKGKIAND